MTIKDQGAVLHNSSETNNGVCMYGVGSSRTTKHLCTRNGTTRSSKINTRRLQGHKQRYQHAAGIELDHPGGETKKSNSHYALSDHPSNRGYSILAIPHPPGASSSTTGHDHQFQVPFSRLQCHQQSFFPSKIRVWSNIPSAAVEASTIGAFKGCLPPVVV
jgi:hypothetical protein